MTFVSIGNYLCYLPAQLDAALTPNSLARWQSEAPRGGVTCHIADHGKPKNKAEV